jgi:hypothetical protein
LGVGLSVIWRHSIHTRNRAKPAQQFTAIGMSRQPVERLDARSNDWASYFHALAYASAQTPKQELYDRAIHPLRALCERGDRRLAVTAQNLLAMALLRVRRVGVAVV